MKRKTVWILNHYAHHMLFDKGGRHYSFAKYLNQSGYKTVVFCANIQKSKTDERYINTEDLWSVKIADDINTPFIYVKARKYRGNGWKRVLNMVDFYRNVKKTAIEYARMNGKPDVILASSVHPLTLVAGIKLAKRFGVKCISEVRDLWPESIVAYSSRWTKNNPIIKILYAGEKWIYKKSDYVIMTWAGGYDYIKDRGWEKEIPESKVVHISNGVDLESYLKDFHDHPYVDSDLLNQNYKNFIYTGSIKFVNNLSVLVATAQRLVEMGSNEAKIIVFGSGNELESLKHEVELKKLNNIIFKGSVPKEYIPSILSQGYSSILHNSSTELNKYGQSQNKLFEYLAAGRPILMTYSVGHSVITKFGCGIELDTQESESIAQTIISMCSLTEEEYRSYCHNALECAKKYDYKNLCSQLISVLNDCVQK